MSVAFLKEAAAPVPNGSGAGGKRAVEISLRTQLGGTDAEGSRCWKNLHVFSKCDLFPPPHLILKRDPDCVCLVAVFIIIFHLFIKHLGQEEYPEL